MIRESIQARARSSEIVGARCYILVATALANVYILLFTKYGDGFEEKGGGACTSLPTAKHLLCLRQ